MIISILLGYKREGIRITQIPLILTFALHTFIYFITGFRFFSWPFYLVSAITIFAWFKYGESDYSKFKPSGPFRVGVKEFTSKEYENDCVIFYPAANDGSG